MAKKTKIKKTYSFKKLANKIDDIIVKDLNTLGTHINAAIQDGIDKGKDIHGNNFVPLEPITIALGGKKILDRTGKMRKTSKTLATLNNLQFIIEMKTPYGVYHNTGFTQTDKQWFPGSRVPGKPPFKREWFGIPKRLKPGGSEYKKAVLERGLRIKAAFKK